MKKTFIFWIPVFAGIIAFLSGVEGCSNDSPTGGSNNNPPGSNDSAITLLSDSVILQYNLLSSNKFGSGYDSINIPIKIKFKADWNDTIPLCTITAQLRTDSYPVGITLDTTGININIQDSIHTIILNPNGQYAKILYFNSFAFGITKLYEMKAYKN